MKPFSAIVKVRLTKGADKGKFGFIKYRKCGSGFEFFLDKNHEWFYYNKYDTLTKIFISQIKNSKK